MQNLIEPMRIRLHNDKAFHAQINGREMDFISSDVAAVKRQIAQQQVEQDRVEIEARMRRELDKNGKS